MTKELNITFKPSTVKDIEAFTQHVLNETFDGNFTRDYTDHIAYTHIDFDGSTVATITPQQLFLLGYLFASIKPSQDVDYETSFLFHNDDGQLGLTLFFKSRDGVTFVFSDDNIAITWDGTQDGRVMALRASIRSLIKTSFFEKRTSDEQRRFKTNDVLVCKEEFNLVNLSNGKAEEIDPLIVPLLNEINQYPGLVTRGCCSGHFDTNNREDERGYISAVFLNQYSEDNQLLMGAILDELYDILAENPIHTFGYAQFSVERSKCITSDLLLRPYWPVNTYSITFHLRDERGQRMLLDTLLKLIIKYNPTREVPQ